MLRIGLGGWYDDEEVLEIERFGSINTVWQAVSWCERTGLFDSSEDVDLKIGSSSKPAAFVDLFETAMSLFLEHDFLWLLRLFLRSPH